MKIPKIFKKERNKYRYVKRCNKDLFLYERIITKGGKITPIYKECFTLHELGLAKEMIKKPRFANRGGEINF